MAKLSLKLTIRSGIMFWLSLFILFVDLIFLQCTLFFADYTDYFKNRVKWILNCDLNQVGIYDWQLSGKYDQEMLFFEELLQNDKIVAISDVSTGATDFSSELANVQNELESVDPEKKYYADNMITGRYMTRKLFLTYSIELMEGRIPDDQEMKEYEKNGFHVIVLGSEFNEIYHAGDRILSDTGNESLYVAAIMKKGSTVLDQGICFGKSGEYYLNGDPLVVLDASVVFLSTYPISTPGLIITRKGYSVDDINDELYALANKYGVSFSVTDMERHIREVEQQNIPEQKMFRMLFIVFTIIGVVSLALIQHVFVRNNKENYGIFLVNGMGTRDLLITVSISLVFRFMISFILASGCSLLLLQTVIGNEANGPVLHAVFFCYVLISSFIFGLLLLLTSSIIPSLIMVRKQEIDYVQVLSD